MLKAGYAHNHECFTGWKDTGNNLKLAEQKHRDLNGPLYGLVKVLSQERVVLKQPIVTVISLTVIVTIAGVIYWCP